VSRIDELIAELCPDGVEFRALGSLGRRNTGISITAAQMRHMHVEGGPVRVFAGGATQADVEEFAVPAQSVIREPSIVVRSRGHISFTYYDQPFTHKNEMWSYTLTDPDTDQSFVYYYLLTRVAALQALARATSVKLPQLSVGDTDRLYVPAPPLEIQREIVKILDTFTELGAELEAELEARRVQYSFYQESLLSFSERDVRWMTLGEIGRVSMCKRVFKDQTSPTGEVPFFKIGTFGGEPDAYISRDLYESYRARFPFPKRGDVLISAAGTIGRAVQYDGEPAYFQDSNIVWIANDESVVKNAYLRYWYRVIEWTTDGGTIRRLYNENIRRARIAVPSLVEQERIVAILDKLDALVNDLSIGLPAELKARRQQHEHFRNRLLTFREAA
jgi:type I restriction enzyme, S subunit